MRMAAPHMEPMKRKRIYASKSRRSTGSAKGRFATRARDFAAINVEGWHMAAKRRRNCSLQLIAIEGQQSQLRQLGNGGWNCSRQLIVVQAQIVQLRQLGNGRRNCSRQLIAVQVQKGQPSQLRNGGWNCSRQLSAVQVQIGQLR